MPTPPKIPHTLNESPAAVDVTCPVCGLEGCEDPAHVAVPMFAHTDAGNSEHFAHHYKDRVRFDHRRGRYLVWATHRWEPDTTGAVRRLVLDAVRGRQHEALKHDDPDIRARAGKWALGSESKSRLDAIYDMAKDRIGIADRGDGWDADPDLLGVPNGVIDLRTGVLRDGHRADRITLQTRVPYDPQATSPLWTKAVQEILVEPEVIHFVQVAFGYSLTGHTREDAWFFCDGSGRNGKGTLMQPLQQALGDYAIEIPAAVFEGSPNHPGRMPYDLALLPGRRFVVCSEAGSIRLNADRIKQLTGGNKQRAANKFERSFEFYPVCKLWLPCNRSRPRVADDSPAFWARLRRITFAQSFLGKEDQTLRPTLCDDPGHQRAVLAWAVAGAVRYYAEGLVTPQRFLDAAAAYEQENDPLAEFEAEALDPDTDATVGAGDLYKHYTWWADRRGFTPRERLTATGFGRRASDRWPFTKTMHGKFYVGLARRTSQ